MEKIKGTIESIKTHDHKTGFSIFKFRLEEGGLIWVKGSIPNILEGMMLSMAVTEKSGFYNQQYEIKSFEEIFPEKPEEIKRLLAKIDGIGSNTADKIVETFGKATIQIFNENIERLKEIKGIGKERYKNIEASWMRHTALKTISDFLQKYELPVSKARSFYLRYGDNGIRDIEENPYRLIEDNMETDINVIDNMAEKLGFDKNSDKRKHCGIIRTIQIETKQGHMYVPRQMLMIKAADYLNNSVEQVSDMVDTMLERGELILEKHFRVDEEPIYLSKHYNIEVEVAEMLMSKRMISAEIPSEDTIVSEEEIKSLIGGDDDMSQIEAVKICRSSGISIINGGPGVGKTHTIGGAIRSFEKDGKTVLLAAPTGKAAARLKEETGYDAQTVHRILGYGGEDLYTKNENNLLEGDVLVIDEYSMNDIWITYHILKAMPEHMRLIICGDQDQIPSIQEGKVLQDIIESGIFPVAELTKVHRQNNKNGFLIINNAAKIKNGDMPVFSDEEYSGFCMIEIKGDDAVVNKIQEMVSELIPREYGVTSDQIQVLTAENMKKLGVNNLNSCLQYVLNSSDDGSCTDENESICYGSFEYRKGDRVIHIKNDYTREIYNGTTGIITAVDEDNEIVSVDYNGHTEEYRVDDLEDLRLNYALTIHKSQGSEYPIVVIPIVNSQIDMLDRKLLYTAVTRAKQAVVFVGSKKTLEKALKKNNSEKRRTLLKERLVALSETGVRG